MSSKKSMKSPPPKKAKIEEPKVAESTPEAAKVASNGDVALEQEYFEYEIVGVGQSEAKQGGGFKTLVSATAVADSGQKKKPSKVFLKAIIIKGVGVVFVLDKGDRQDVYPEKYFRDVVQRMVEIEGAEAFFNRHCFLREVSATII